MHKIDINGNTLEVFDSIDELPVTRFFMFNRFLLIDAGVGSDLQDFDNHISTMIRYLDKGDTEKATKELLNLRQNVSFIYEQQNPKLNAFVPLIRSINGEVLTDLSTENIQNVLKRLGNSGLAVSAVYRWVSEAKKKLKSSLIYFSRKREKAHG